ncbi:MAG: hypothetical protein RIC95_14590 [Vicingaceae bacterium]
MEKDFNLLKLKYPKRRFWIGLACFLVLGLSLLYDYYTQSPIRFEGLHAICIIFGIQHLYESKGFSLNQLFGESYLKFDNEQIRYKPKLFKAEQTLHWEEVNYLKDYASRLFLVKHNSESLRIDLSTLEAEQLKEVRDAFADVAMEKNLAIRTASRKSA